MKKKILRFFQLTLLAIAVFAANTPSQIGMYQPKCPKELKNKNRFFI